MVGENRTESRREPLSALTRHPRFCHPRCCNHTITRGCSLSALMKHQQMDDNISTASPLPPSLGGRCSLKKSSQNGFRCDRFVNSQAAMWKSLLLPKMCSLEHHRMSSVFTATASLRLVPQEKGSEGHQRNIRSQGVSMEVLAAVLLSQLGEPPVSASPAFQCMWNSSSKGNPFTNPPKSQFPR